MTDVHDANNELSKLVAPVKGNETSTPFVKTSHQPFTIIVIILVDAN